MPTSPIFPEKLGKEPILDAVFEIRVEPESSLPLSRVLPGVLLSAMQQRIVGIENLPISELPEQIRETQRTMRYLPSVRVIMDSVVINIGDRVISIGIRGSYPGWNVFKEHIIEISKIALQKNYAKAVERYSLKYIDFMESDLTAPPLASLNLKINVSGRSLTEEGVVLRTEFVSSGLTEILQIATKAEVTVKNRPPARGSIIDIDVISNDSDIPFDAFLKNIDERVDSLHTASKTLFFNCLTDALLNKLEPVHD